MAKIGSLDPEILAKKWSKSGQIEVSERFFEKISRNMTDTEKMLISIVVGNRIVRIKKKSLKSVQWFSGSGVMVKIVTDLSATRHFMRGRYFLRKSREI